MEQVYIEDEKKSGFDIGRYISKLGKNIKWFLLAVVICGIGSYLYLQYSVPMYQVSSSILIKPSTSKNILGGSAFSGATGGESSIDVGNEIFKLQSPSIIGQLVDSLQLWINVDAVTDNKSKAVALESLPFALSVRRSFIEQESPLYTVTLFQNYYNIEGNSKTVKGTYNQPLVFEGEVFTLQPQKSITIPDNTQYTIQFSGRSATISKYKSRLKVAPIPKAGEGMLQVSLMEEVPERAKKVIDLLVKTYDISNLNYNTQALHKEMKFLNERIASVSAELDAQSKLVRDFKTGNRIYDVSASANQLLGSLPAIDARKSDIALRNDLLNLVENNIKSYNGREEIVPNSSGLQDPVLGDQISKYNQLVLQKRTILDNGTEQDLRLEPVNGQMQELRNNILKNVRNIRSEIRANANSLSEQERSITGRFTSIPEKEKEMIELNRILGIKQSLYTFLLQKREDKNMELASTEIAESRIIDNGFNVARYPKPLIIYGIALAIGLLLPALIILLRILGNKKIETRQDVELLTALPIAGEIGRIENGREQIVISPDKTSSEAEQFRTLRTNISYMTRGLSQKVLLVTSTKSEEGKSFVSLNLATSIAISNKRVALLEFDLRNPGIADKLGIGDTVGLGNYLMGEVEVQDIVQKTTVSDNLFFFSCGHPLPPNPGELIMDDKMQTLFAFLKANFDVIVIDTPPVGPVSDALILGKWADVSFFIIRHKHTLRSALKLINKLNIDKKLPHLTLIINGIVDNREFNYGNDFGYGYGYEAKDKKKKRNYVD